MGLLTAGIAGFLYPFFASWLWPADMSALLLWYEPMVHHPKMMK